MKKSLTSLFILSSMTLSATALANTMGPTPKCTSGALNMEVYVKDVDSCPDDISKTEYCIMEVLGTSVGDHGIKCEDDEDLFIKNDNESYSFNALPSYASLSHLLGSRVNGVLKNQRLNFVYDHGKVSDNCADVFAPDVKCVITKSGDKDHPLYTLTISKAQ